MHLKPRIIKACKIENQEYFLKVWNQFHIFTRSFYSFQAQKSIKGRLYARKPDYISLEALRGGDPRPALVYGQLHLVHQAEPDLQLQHDDVVHEDGVDEEDDPGAAVEDDEDVAELLGAFLYEKPAGPGESQEEGEEDFSISGSCPKDVLPPTTRLTMKLPVGGGAGETAVLRGRMELIATLSSSAQGAESSLSTTPRRRWRMWTPSSSALRAERRKKDENARSCSNFIILSGKVSI